MCAWVRFLRLLLLNNLQLAFEKSLFFSLNKSILSLMFKYFRPYKHERLSTIAGKTILVSDPYFSSMKFNNEVKWWYRNVLVDRI